MIPPAMRALIVPEWGRLELRDDIPTPTIRPHQALVRIECCGICSSTDWKVIRGQMAWAGRPPLLLGHESVGRVVRVGERVRRFREGDRVTRPIFPPGLNGWGSAFGGFAEYGIVTDVQAMASDGDDSMLDDYNARRQNVVPVGIEPADAALAISLAETASVLRLLPNLNGKRVVVAGTGVAGLALTRWCKLAGAFVVTLGRREPRLSLAREIGADAVVDTRHDAFLQQTRDACPGPVDGLIEAIGDVAFADRLLDLLEDNAFACAYGAPAGDDRFDPRWRVADVREQHNYPWVCDMIQRGWVRSDSFVSHSWPFDRVREAFEAVRAGDVVKGIVQVTET